MGAGRPYDDQPLVIRAMLVLTYMRLHIPQEVVALLFGATQPDVSRELRWLLPLIAQLGAICVRVEHCVGWVKMCAPQTVVAI